MAWLHILRAVSQPSGHGFGGVLKSANVEVYTELTYLLMLTLHANLDLYPHL